MENFIANFSFRVFYIHVKLKEGTKKMNIKSINQQSSFKGAIIVPNNAIANSRKLIPELCAAKKCHSQPKYEIFLFKTAQKVIEEKIMSKLEELNQNVMQYTNGKKNVPLRKAIKLAEMINLN